MSLTRLIFSLAIASLAWGHAISFSVSEGELTGNSLDLRVRLPRYETEHVPAGGIGAAIQFSGAKMLSQDCAPAGEDLACHMSFEFAAPIGEAIEATVTLARITVPNHVHIMRLTRLGIARQGVFDRSFETERIDFHQEAPFETWWRGARLGFVQMGYQPLLLLLVLAVGLVAKPPAYLVALLAAFFVTLPDRFYAPAGFFELATALALTYLALEHLFFSQASGRWLVSAVIGALEGAALAVMARPAGPGAISLAAGSFAAQTLLCLLAWRFSRNLSDVWIRRTMWGTLAAGAISSIWVFVKRF